MKNLELKDESNPKYAIDYSKPVKLYRNLNNGKWSLMQNGIVKAYASKLALKDCSFKVSEKSRQRVLKNKRKNVHAFIVGILSNELDENENLKEVTYCPYKGGEFHETDGKPVISAKYIFANIDAKKHVVYK